MHLLSSLPPYKEPITNHLSSLNACPKSDLTIFDIETTIANTVNLIQSSTTNCSILEDNPDYCVSTLGFDYDAGKPIYNVLNLTDEPGTEPLSNSQGNPFTDFGAPAYTLLLFPGVTTTITPAPFDKDAGAATATSGSTDATASDTGSATETGSAGATTAAASGSAAGSSSAAAATTTKGGAGALMVQDTLLVGSFAAVIFQLLM
jgi:hypothetical protein